MRNVSGTLRCGQMNAVMGPSGCGKSTLLSVLSGQIRQSSPLYVLFFSLRLHTSCCRAGALSGERRVGGKVLDIDSYDRFMRQNSGYVQQTDSSMSSSWNLTVWETLAYASLLRLPAQKSTREKVTFSSYSNFAHRPRPCAMLRSCGGPLLSSRASISHHAHTPR